MLTLRGINIDDRDAETLAAALDARGNHAALEAAAAIRWGAATGATVDDLDQELAEEIRGALEHAPARLAPLRHALAATRPSLGRRAARRVHNPRGRVCGCLADCWCRSTLWGRAVRWYVPRQHHQSASACWKAGCEHA